MVRLLALTLALSVSLAAQTGSRSRRKSTPKPAPAAAPASARFPIEQIEVLGNKNLTAAQIIRASGLKTGVTGSQQELEKMFEEVRNRLLATGYFERVGAGYQPAKSGKGYLATLQVTEMQQIFPYRFEDLSIPPEKIEAALRQLDPLFAPKIPGSQPILDRYAAEIQKLAGPEQKHKVIGRLALDASNEYVVVFRPDIPLPTVAEVRFTGTAGVPEGRVRAAVAGAAVGTPYTEKRFRQVLELNARPVYESQGYLKTTFGEIKTAPARDVTGLIVTVKVNEGVQYKLKDVIVHAPVERPGELARVGKFKIDDVADFSQIEEGRKRIEAAMKGGGRFNATSTIKRDLDDKAKTVTVTITVNGGPLYTFGKLIIQGLDLNAEAEIRKLWGLKAGKPFNAGYPDYFLSRIREDGYFENLGRTSASSKVDEAAHTVDVTLNFLGAGADPKGLLRPDRRPQPPPQQP